MQKGYANLDLIQVNQKKKIRKQSVPFASKFAFPVLPSAKQTQIKLPKIK